MTATATDFFTRAFLDGMLEGPVPPIEDADRHLREWVEFASSSGLEFELTIDGPSFSMLAANSPVVVPSRENFADRVQQCIEQLLNVFPEDLRGSVSSTVRSREERGDQEVQTVYLVTAEGVKVKARHVDPAEEKADRSFSLRSLKQYMPLAIFGVVLLVVFVGSLFVLDYSEVWSRLQSKYELRTADRYEIDLRPVSRYVDLEKKGLERGHLVVEARRTEHYPTTVEGYQTERERARGSDELPHLLAFEKVVIDGSLKYALLDREGKVLAEGEVSVRNLAENEKTTIRIPVREHPRTKKVRFGF